MSAHKHIQLLAISLIMALTAPALAQDRHLARGLDSMYKKGVPGISRPHNNVVKQLRTAAGGKIRGPVYVVRYGTKAAQKLTSMMKGKGFGMIYKGSAWTGHNMAWLGGKFTDAVPGSKSFKDGSKTRWHDFRPLAERAQLVAAFDVPGEPLKKAILSAANMAKAKKSCGADCAGYVRDIGKAISDLTSGVAPNSGIARLGSHLKTYLAPTPLRNATLKEADAVILMTPKNDWRKPEHESYNINDWNGKQQ